MFNMVSYAVYVNKKYKGAFYAYPEWEEKQLFKEAKREFLNVNELMAPELQCSRHNRNIYITVSNNIEQHKITRFEVVFNLKYQGLIEGFPDSTDDYLIIQAKQTYLHENDIDRDTQERSIQGRVERRANKIFLWDANVALGLTKPAKGLYEVLYNGKTQGEIFFDPKTEGGEADLYRKAKNTFLQPNEIKFNQIENYFSNFKVYLINFDKLRSDNKKENEAKKSTVKITIYKPNKPPETYKAPEPIKTKRFEHPIISYE